MSACVGTADCGRDALGRGVRLHRRFHGRSPASVSSAWARLAPPVVTVGLGDLLGLIYRSDRGPHGGLRTYVHLLQQPPRLVCDVSGRQLYIVGGSYRVTGRGIEG